MKKKIKANKDEEKITNKDIKIQKQFFKAMFHTFGYTLLAFLGLLFILFIVLWIRK